ncbi:hypothetical protein ASG31_10305 [Chryseobacterium sp. Leaf404]|uniref:DUF6923 family protein n=1 Tax=unclassified Chryseobacterium TaxID=2593645 RepID=UPI0006F7C744|nr:MULTISPECIES: DUF11 domain-containing protein [unclassified Chryseobacterium]KQT16763.1 hypothetical protein ASG31_10305 [Chryseobacterium sp. Leaf404]
MKKLYTVLLISLFVNISIHAQTNLAIGKNVTYSTGTGSAAALVDGDFSTNFQTGSTQSHPDAEWIQIDLGADYPIENIALGGLGVGTNDRRFMIVTWPSTVAFTPTAQPDSGTYLSNSFLNRLIYTEANAQLFGNNLFGETAGNPNTPGNAGQNLGPVFPTETINAVSRPVLRLNVGIHEARYIRIISLQDTSLGFSEVQVFQTNVPPVRVFKNGGFEQGSVGLFQDYISEALVPGWSTTDPLGMNNDNPAIPVNGSFMEFWRSGFGSVIPAEGNYFVELNAGANGMLVQEPMCVLPNETFSWSFAHRGRSGVDRMALVINDQDVAQFDDNNSSSGTHQVVSGSVAASTTAVKVSTNANGWTYYEGTWTNSSSSSQTINFGFRAVSSSGGQISAGNFLDDVKIVTTNTVAGFNNPTYQGLEVVPTANLPKIILSGSVPVASTVQLNITGGTAVRGVDYTTVPATGLINITIPAGNYDGTLATAISLDSYISIVNDGSAESDETIIMALQNPTGNVLLPGANYCLPFFTPITYTIEDFSAFTCSPSLYLSQYPNGGPTSLYSLNSAANPFTTTLIGTSTAGMQVNAIGYNIVDNFIYGVRTDAGNQNHLVKIDSNGNEIDLGAVTGLPTGGYNSGDFDDLGNFYVINFASTSMYRINVSTLTATSITLSRSLSVNDIAFDKTSGLFYGFDGANRFLVSINTTSGVVINIGVANTTITGLVGAMFSNSTGEIFGNADNGSGFYQFNKVTGVTTLISTSVGAFGNDGAHCINSPIIFPADLAVTKTDNKTQYIPGTTNTYTIVVSNSGPFGVVGASVSDPLPAGIPAANVSYTAVASSGSSTNVLGTQTGAINDLVSLPVGGTVTYTVNILVPITFTGNLVNTVTVTPPSSSSDSTPANNTATDTDTTTACYNNANTASAGVDSKHGITLLKRAGADNGNWPMIRKSAHTVLESNTKGFVVTRMTSDPGQTAAVNHLNKITNPQDGMMVYDMFSKCLKVYVVDEVTPGNSAWSCFSAPACQ